MSTATPDANSLIQRVHFAAVKEHPEVLYAKTTESGSAVRSRDSITLSAGTGLSTRAYFGRVQASYLQRWTKTTQVTFTMTVTGTGTIELWSDDYTSWKQRITSTAIDAREPQQITLTAATTEFLDGGHIWFDALASVDELTIADVQVWSNAESRPRPTSIVICTYNRAPQCLDNLDTVSSDPVLLDALESIYVVDQGTQHPDELDGFDDVAKALGGRLQVIRQENLGGSGGFTRGMYETLRAAEGRDVNILLMDDDIELEPESLLRLIWFEAVSPTDRIIGAQMLHQAHQTTLQSHAEYGSASTLELGLQTDPRSAMVDLRKQLPEKRMNAQYNAWWTCLVPSSVPREIGLPLPFFIKYDDAEFGIRAQRRGIATVTLPGAAVWHADFQRKDHDDWAVYFFIRNGLAVASLYGGDVATTAKTLRELLVEHLLTYRYGMASMLIKSIEDFLAGPSELADGGVSAMKDVRALRAEYPETKRLTAEDVSEAGLDTLIHRRHEGVPSRPGAVKAKRLLWQFLGRAQQPEAISSDSAWWHASMFRKVLIVDASQDAFHIREFDSQKAKQLGIEGMKVIHRYKKEAAAAADQWREAMPRLTSEENWERLFAADQS